MRCYGSPTTFTAADLPATRADQALRACDVMNAVLFREILKPLARDLGPLGEIAAGEVADALFVRGTR